MVLCGKGIFHVKVNKRNFGNNCYYLPGIILYGVVENTGVESNQLYYQSEEAYPIVALNAVDGTIVAMSNE